MIKPSTACNQSLHSLQTLCCLLEVFQLCGHAGSGSAKSCEKNGEEFHLDILNISQPAGIQNNLIPNAVLVTLSAASSGASGWRCICACYHSTEAVSDEEQIFPWLAWGTPWLMLHIHATYSTILPYSAQTASMHGSCLIKLVSEVCRP